MDIINKCLNKEEFKEYIKTYNFGALPANKLVIHHTWRPTKEQWNGKYSIEGLKQYYESKYWPRGPHLFIAEDGIWLFTPMRQNGIHAGIGNWRSIGIEVVGDYDAEKWSGKTKDFALFVIKALQEKLGIKNEYVKFHRDYSSKSCPGYAITKEWLFKQLADYDKPKTNLTLFEMINRLKGAGLMSDEVGIDSKVSVRDMRKFLDYFLTN